MHRASSFRYTKSHAFKPSSVSEKKCNLNKINVYYCGMRILLSDEHIKNMLVSDII
jgi:hypothetical protein